MKISLYVFSFLFLSTLFCSCNKSKIVSNITVLTPEAVQTSIGFKDFKYWYPSIEEIALAKELIQENLIESNLQISNQETFGNALDYYYQLVPYINQEDNRIIFVNSLCEHFIKNPPPNLDRSTIQEQPWKNYFLSVYDGGSCFWNFKINIDSKESFGLRINGI